MTDKNLRELERQWKETGSPEAEAAYLLERVRTGDLDRERLELAAYCGHEGAVAAVGGPQDPDLRELVGRLEGCGRVVVATAACAVASACLPVFQQAYPSNRKGKATIKALREWLSCPCDRHKREIPSGYLMVSDRAGMEEIETALRSETEQIKAARLSIQSAARTPASIFKGMAAVTHAEKALGRPKARAAIAAEIVPWSLGNAV